MVFNLNLDVAFMPHTCILAHDAHTHAHVLDTHMYAFNAHDPPPPPAFIHAYAHPPAESCQVSNCHQQLLPLH
jgi:hypothetical protein